MTTIKFHVTEVSERTRILSGSKDANDEARFIEERYWCVVINPGFIAMDFGSDKPDISIGDIVTLTFRGAK